MFNKKLLVIFSLVVSFAASLVAQSADIESGLKLIQNERYSEAKKHFTSLLNSASKADAYFYLGQIYFIEDKYDSAKMSYTAGIKVDDESQLNYAGLAKINIAEKNTAEFEKNQEAAIDVDKKNSDMYVVIAEGYLSEAGKNVDKAIEQLNLALKYNPKNVRAHIYIGNVYLEKGDGTDAIKHFQQAMDADPTNPEAFTLKARIYSLINSNNEAIALLEEAIKKDPSYPHSHEALAEIYATMKDYAKASEHYAQYMNTSEPTPEKQKRYASILYLNKDYQKAIDVLKEVYKTQPNNASTVRIIAYSYLRMEDTENSKSYFKTLFEIPNADFLTSDYENYADLLSKTGDDSMAVEYLYKVVELDSTRKDALGKISVLCFKNKRWDCVTASLERKGSLSAQEIFDLGKAYYFAKDTLMADTTFGKLIESKPGLAIAYHWKARIKSAQDSTSELGLAQPFYQKFVELAEPDSNKYKKELVEAYSYLGYYYFLKEDKSNSLMYWEKVAAIDPENSQAKDVIEQLKKTKL